MWRSSAWHHGHSVQSDPRLNGIYRGWTARQGPSLSSFRGTLARSEDGRQWKERVRQERAPRQRVHKVWRSVRWADSFPDESATMEVSDITPQFALRKMAVLFETRRFEECAALLRRLSPDTLAALAEQVPVELLHEAVPESLCVMEALYTRLYNASPDNFPSEQLHTDDLVKKMVALFAGQFQMNNRSESVSAALPRCRSLLQVLAALEPRLGRAIRQRRRALERCLRSLGRHGHVPSSGGKLMTLHDALKVEFERVVIQLRCALQKLEELSLAGRHPPSLTSGPAPTQASHQRQMQVTRGDVQDRVIKNKTLLNALEPVAGSTQLDKLLKLLEKRIEYDKAVLFHDTELRKMSGGTVDDDVFLSVLLRQFAQGYSMLLEVLKEAGAEDEDDEEDKDGGDEDVEDSSGDEEAITSTLSLLDRMKAKSLNGIIPFRGVGGRSHGGPRGVHAGSISTASVLSGYSVASKPGLPDALVNGVAGGGMADSKIRGLEREVENLTQELEQAREQIWKLQDREKQLRDRLSEQAQKQFAVGTSHFENLSLGGRRPTELVRQFGALYTEGRLEALDALDTLPELEKLDVLKMKILFSVLVLSFRAAQQALEELRGRLRHLLCLPVPLDHRTGAAKDAPPPDPPAQALEESVTRYLLSTVDRFDLSAQAQEVSNQIYATLYDYPCLRRCKALQDFTERCLRLCWGLVCQSPPYVIAHEARTFDPTQHTRFHTSDPECTEIHSFLWPALLEADSRTCVLKAVVIT